MVYDFEDWQVWTEMFNCTRLQEMFLTTPSLCAVDLSISLHFFFTSSVNVNADLIVSGKQLFEMLKLVPSGNKKDHLVLKSLADLEETFSFYFEKGAGVERFFANQEEFINIVNSADNLEEKDVGFLFFPFGVGCSSAYL